jgi:hypothetical protein
MCALVLALGSEWPRAIHAASWSITPEAWLTAGYDDNVRLTNTPVASYTEALHLSAALERTSNAFALTFAPQFTAVRYGDQPVLDRNDIDALAGARFAQERGQWSLTGRFVRDSTLTSELGSTGLSETSEPHESISIVAETSRVFAERWSASAQLSWAGHAYPQSEVNDELVDYDYNVAYAQTKYALNERTSIALDASFARLIVPEQRAESKNYAANASYDTAIGDRWKISLAAGPILVESDEFRDDGVGYSASIERRAERSTLRAEWSRDVTPTGRGVLSKRERSALVAAANFSERASAELSAQWIENRDLIPTLGVLFGSVRYAQLHCGTRWRVTSTWSATGSLEWRWQESEDATSSPGVARSYLVNLGIAWNGLQRSVN